ncbi:MerP [Fulvivirga imtechensis AK7]|uniref:MerP n=2 Tax=Fulvivirga TaxID=396811 RepID=L8JVM4_9BACT|nr:MerP [Fulvivirga imtechensis AK7]
MAFVVACNKPAENVDTEATTEERHEHEDMHEGEQATTADFSGISDEQSKNVISSYLEVKDALVATEADQAKEGAKKMLAALEGAEGSRAVSGLKEDARHIVDTDEMEYIREHFDQMSQNIYALAKAKNTGMTLYKQHCPMAFDNQGAYWLSSSKEIRNPYFGDKMLKCGAVKETIASK